MKQIFALCMMVFAMGAQALPSYYTGEISGSGVYSDTLNSNTAWVNPPVFGMNSASKDVSLWGYSAATGDSLSLDVSSSDDFIAGISIYFGEVTQENLLYGLFNNSGDFGLVDYIAGTTTYMADSTLSDIKLDMAGFYTIVIGGKNGFGWDSNYAYDLTVNATSNNVPAPGILLLLATGLFGVVYLRRQQHA